jgi:hypothetical protein
MNLTTTRAQNLSARAAISLTANPDLELATIDSFRQQADIWVKLCDRPNDYSDDEALLLCETDSEAWLSWVAGFGQVELQPGEFYRLI